MATIAKKQISKTGKFLKSVIAAAALSTCAFAQAGVVTIDFEGAAPSVVTTDTRTVVGNYFFEAYGGATPRLPGDLAGLIIDGSDSNSCVTITCPVNNTSRYYAALDDGFVVVGLASNERFVARSLQASFIGAGQASFPAVSGILQLQGYNALGGLVGAASQIQLSGPTGSPSAFRFANYNLGAFGNNQVSFVRILGFACDASGSCDRTSNLSNFAIDNIVLNEVPEPLTLGLFGLGLAGLAASRRRRSA